MGTTVVVLLVMVGFNFVDQAKKREAQKRAEEEVLQLQRERSAAVLLAQQQFRELEEQRRQLELQRQAQEAEKRLSLFVLPIIASNASSVLPETKTNNYSPERAYDGEKSTAWQENSGTGGIGEWIEFEFDDTYFLKKIVLINGYAKYSSTGLDRFLQNSRIKRITLRFQDGSSQYFDLRDLRESQEVSITPIYTKSVKLEIIDCFPGDKWKDNGISEISFWGTNG